MHIFHNMVSPRDALAAPTHEYEIYWQSVAILIVAIMSILGAAWIIASFFAFSNLRSFRHQLILGLAFSDCVMAINFLVSASMNVSGHLIGDPEQTAFCSFNGFMTQVFVIQTDYWVLSIALCTFFILADWKRAGSWVQDHKRILWSLPWVFSLIWAGIGLGTAGYGDIGAWCWFTSDEVRLLVNFVPRWAIIAFMLLLYVRIYFILYKAHNRFVSFDEEAHGNPNPNSTPSNAAPAPRPRVFAKESSLNESGSGGRHGRHNRKLKRLARMMLLYPLAYALIWFLPTTIRIYQTISGKSAPWQLQTVDKSCIVIQGFVDAVIYGINETSMSSWRNLIWPEAFPVLDAGNAPNTDANRGAGGGGGGGAGGSGAWHAKKNRMSGMMISDPSMMTNATGSSHSLEISEISADKGTPVEVVEMQRLGERGAGMGMGRIMKTVEVEIRSSSTGAEGLRDDMGRTFFNS